MVDFADRIRARRSSWLVMMLLSLLVLGFVIACQPRSQLPSPIASSPPLSKQCATTYNPATDYFPDKVQFRYAQGVSVAYHPHYKVVTIRDLVQPSKPPIVYVLVQCGAPVPAGVKGTVITVPIATIAALSSTYLPHLEKLGVLDRLVAIDHGKQVNNPTVRARVQTKTVQEVGTDSTLNLERLLELAPDLVMTYQISGSTTNNDDRLMAAGLKVAINAEYLETSPLGRAEWLKFTALFFNQEAAAEQLFTTIADRYRQVAAAVAKVSDRPSVLAGLDISGTWYMPGGKSYVAHYFRDAGANYLWADNPSTGSIPLSFEAVLDRAAQAKIWLTSSLGWQNQADILATDPRYSNFVAVRTKQVFNNNARVNATGGNDYWENGVTNPDVVLSDLVKILHPTLLPAHQLVYYRRLE